MKNLRSGLAAAVSIAALAAGAPALAAPLLSFAGPTAHMASPGFVDETFTAGAGTGEATFTIDGFNTLDGVVSNNLEDDFILSLNGVDILRGTWDLGGGGSSHIFFAPISAVFDPHTDGFGLGGQVVISTPLAFVAGANTLRFAFESAKPEGITNESWALQGLTVVGPPSAAPEPAEWALLLAGFAGLGAGLRQARRSPPLMGRVARAKPETGGAVALTL